MSSRIAINRSAVKKILLNETGEALLVKTSEFLLIFVEDLIVVTDSFTASNSSPQY